MHVLEGVFAIHLITTTTLKRKKERKSETVLPKRNTKSNCDCYLYIPCGYYTHTLADEYILYNTICVLQCCSTQEDEERKKETNIPLYYMLRLYNIIAAGRRVYNVII